jgi:hypothetical protein
VLVAFDTANPAVRRGMTITTTLSDAATGTTPFAVQEGAAAGQATISGGGSAVAKLALVDAG